MEPHEDPESRVGEGAAQRNAHDGRRGRGAAVGGRGRGFATGGRGRGRGFGASGRGSGFHGGSFRGFRGGFRGGFSGDYGGGGGGGSSHSAGRQPGDNEDSRAFLGRRAREEPQDASSDVIRAVKRVNATTSGPAVSTRLANEDVNVERTLFGEIVASNFSMSSLTEAGATDVILHSSQRDGWNSVVDVARGLAEQGHEKIKMTIKPLASQPRPFSVGKYGRKPDIRNIFVPFGEEPPDEEVDDDAATDPELHEIWGYNY